MFQNFAVNLLTLFRNVHRISPDVTLMWKLSIIWHVWKMLVYKSRFSISESSIMFNILSRAQQSVECNRLVKTLTRFIFWNYAMIRWMLNYITLSVAANFSCALTRSPLYNSSYPHIFFKSSGSSFLGCLFSKCCL